MDILIFNNRVRSYDYFNMYFYHDFLCISIVILILKDTVQSYDYFNMYLSLSKCSILVV